MIMHRRKISPNKPARSVSLTTAVFLAGLCGVAGNRWDGSESRHLTIEEARASANDESLSGRKRRTAAFTISTIGEKAASSLRELADSDSPDVRAEALRGLRRLQALASPR